MPILRAGWHMYTSYTLKRGVGPRVADVGQAPLWLSFPQPQARAWQGKKALWHVGRTGQGHRRDAPLGQRSPPSGGASIASGYTPPALAGALPRHPQP